MKAWYYVLLIPTFMQNSVSFFTSPNGACSANCIAYVGLVSNDPKILKMDGPSIKLTMKIVPLLLSST